MKTKYDIGDIVKLTDGGWAREVSEITVESDGYIYYELARESDCTHCEDELTLVCARADRKDLR